MNSKLFIFTFLILFSFSSKSQEISGLWQVTSVNVGEQQMTPIAKWFHIGKDNTYTSGNGGITNSAGTWHYNAEAGEFLPLETNGLKNPFGPFRIKFEDEMMRWERNEEGAMVTVLLKRITEKPMATFDKLYGAWKLTSINDQVVPIGNKTSIFIRWDREYRLSDVNGIMTSGIWQINAHKPELTFIPEDSNKALERWHVEVNDSELILTGISDKIHSQKKTFKRSDVFPG
ncbi:hypothetical protein NE848_02595 [Gramella jeungdoensis]|uniref:Lipocalin-like domain-containing protein n=1 Tax=Gramella jeungdoensis TaxID=708091 RepID=A0ABT0YXQ3_9FLAO|nr:hypothetical protein [Gramella jeungdoensis]MCM8568248.1 hypothetical protein [Gramella jeungdoensis]